MPGIFFKFFISLQSRGEIPPTGTTPHRCQQWSCVSPAKAGQAAPVWKQHHPTPAGLASRTNPHPELMRLIALVLPAWKMYRLNGQDKRTGQRHSGGGFCRSSSEKTIVTLRPPALVSSCYHTTLLLNSLQGFLAPPCHPLANLLLPFTIHTRNTW